MHPTTMQAIAAQRGADLHKDATAAQRARQARRSQSWERAQPTQQTRPVVPIGPMPRKAGPDASGRIGAARA